LTPVEPRAPHRRRRGGRGQAGVPILALPDGTHLAAEGLHGGERSVRIPYVQLLRQARDHLEVPHAQPQDVQAESEEWRHAMMRAAVGLLID